MSSTRRRSRMPRQRDSALCAGVELGGTKCVCVLGTGPADIRAEVRLETRGPTETLRDIGQVLSGWRREHAFAALGIGSFGPADLDPRSATYGSLTRTPKRGWDAVALL